MSRNRLAGEPLQSNTFQKVGKTFREIKEKSIYYSIEKTETRNPGKMEPMLFSNKDDLETLLFKWIKTENTLP